MLLLVLYAARRLIRAEGRGLETLDRLLAAAERVQELYDDAPTGYLSANADGEITEVNATLCELARPGRARRCSAAGSSTSRPSETRPGVQRALDDLRLGRVIEDLEFDLVRADGDPLAVGMRAEPRRDTDGALVLVRVTLFDATQQRAAERAAGGPTRGTARSSRRRTRASGCSTAGRTTFVNPRAASSSAASPRR